MYVCLTVCVCTVVRAQRSQSRHPAGRCYLLQPPTLMYIPPRITCLLLGCSREKIPKIYSLFERHCGRLLKLVFDLVLFSFLSHAAPDLLLLPVPLLPRLWAFLLRINLAYNGGRKDDNRIIVGRIEH